MCIQCELLYKFDDCTKRVGSETAVVCCKNIVFIKKCNQPINCDLFQQQKLLFIEYCYTSLVISLQTLVGCTGFIEQCESTWASFSSQLSNVYDGTLWNNFLTVEGSSFLSKFDNYGIFEGQLTNNWSIEL